MDPKKAFSLLNEADTEDSTTASFVKKMMQEKPLVRLDVPENKLDGKKTEPRKLDKEETGKKRKAENSDEAEDVKPKKGATKAALKAASKTDNDNEEDEDKVEDDDDFVSTLSHAHTHTISPSLSLYIYILQQQQQHTPL